MRLDIIIAGICTIGIFSYLYRENKFYRLLEHLFIGLATGYSVIATLKTYLYPKVIKPLFGIDSTEYNYLNLLHIIPIIFGLFYYFLYSKKYNWLGKLTIGITLGASGTLAFKGILNRLFPQIESSFKSLIVKNENGFDYLQMFNNLFFVLTLLLVLNYFIFSLKFREKQNKISNIGRYLLMICFGTFFGSTIMARLALLVERIQFLYFDWLESIFKW